MRVLLVNKFNYLKGGAAKYFLDLAGLLEDNGIKVAKFSMDDPKNLPDKNSNYFVSNIDFNSFNPKNIFKYIERVLYSREAAEKFESLIKDFKPDIIHLHNFYHQISPSIIPVAKKHGIPIVMHLHDYKLICPNYKVYSRHEICYRCKGNKYYNCLTRKCLKDSLSKSFLAMIEAYLHNVVLKTYDKVDLFIAPSQFMKDLCVEFGVPEEKIRVVHNFIEFDRFSRNTVQHATENYLLYWSRLSDEKGVDIAIKSMRWVDGNLSLKIAGIGPEQDNLNALIKKLGFGNRVELVGSKYGDELIEIINKAKAIIIPSVLPENMPLTLLEGMTSSKVVIASNAGGIPEIITDNSNGFLFESGNDTDLADKINNLGKADLGSIGRRAFGSMVSLKSHNHLIRIKKAYASILPR